LDKELARSLAKNPDGCASEFGPFGLAEMFATCCSSALGNGFLSETRARRRTEVEPRSPPRLDPTFFEATLRFNKGERLANAASVSVSTDRGISGSEGGSAGLTVV